MDDLTAAIEITRSERARAQEEVVRWVRQVELFDVKIEAYEEAARLRPLRAETTKIRLEGNGSKGRQPGAISKRWRSILHMMFLMNGDGGTDEQEIAELARNLGVPNARPKDMRDRMMAYEKHGYVEPAINGWRVTELAAAKFGADSPETDSDSDEDADDHD